MSKPERRESWDCYAYCGRCRWTADAPFIYEQSIRHHNETGHSILYKNDHFVSFHWDTDDIRVATIAAMKKAAKADAEVDDLTTDRWGGAGPDFYTRPERAAA